MEQLLSLRQRSRGFGKWVKESRILCDTFFESDTWSDTRYTKLDTSSEFPSTRHVWKQAASRSSRPPSPKMIDLLVRKRMSVKEEHSKRGLVSSLGDVSMTALDNSWTLFDLASGNNISILSRVLHTRSAERVPVTHAGCFQSLYSIPSRSF